MRSSTISSSWRPEPGANVREIGTICLERSIGLSEAARALFGDAEPYFSCFEIRPRRGILRAFRGVWAGRARSRVRARRQADAYAESNHAGAHADDAHADADAHARR